MQIRDVMAAPTKPQYKGMVNFRGVLLGIEHVAGDVNPWSERKTRASYGEIPNTTAGDGDPVDVLLGDKWDSTRAFVLQQIVPEAGQAIDVLKDTDGSEGAQYDEDKVVLGADSEAEARRLFEDYYHGAGRTIGGVIELSFDDLGERIGACDGMPLTKASQDWSDAQVLAKGGPYIGPRGGKWADAKHTIPWKEDAAPKFEPTYRQQRIGFKGSKFATAWNGPAIQATKADVRKALSSGMEVYRGTKSGDGSSYATDPGFYGRGVYTTTDPEVAWSYGRNLFKYQVKLEKPLVLSVDEAREIAHQHGLVEDNRMTAVHGEGAVESAGKLTERLRARGHDGVAIMHRTSVEVLSFQDVKPTHEFFGRDDWEPLTKASQDWSDAQVLHKSDKPPSGFTAIPNSRHKGFRKKSAHGWDYWYPDQHEGHHPEDRQSPVEGLRSKVGAEHFTMYSDVASGTDPAKWRGYMEKYGYSGKEADQLREALTTRERDQKRDHAREQWNKEGALAFGGADFAGHVVGKVEEAGLSSGVAVGEGLERVGRVLGGLEKKYPAVRAAIRSGLIRGIVPVKPGRGAHEASYNPRTGNIEIGREASISGGVLLHEVGHAVEEKAPDGWMHGAGWRAGQPSASRYAASGNPSEQFAEAFVHLVAGDGPGFYQHSPEQAKVVAQAVQRLSAGEKMQKAQKPPGGGWTPIPKGKKGGYRKRKGAGWDYWYPDQHEVHHHPDWERDPGASTGVKDLAPNSIVEVGGRTGVYRYTPEHKEAPDGHTWVTSMETGEHEMVRTKAVHRMRGYDPEERKRKQRPPRPPQPPPPKQKPPGKGGGGKPPEKPPERPPDAPPREGEPGTETAGPGAKMAIPFKRSTADPKQHPIRHKLESGGYMLARFKDSHDRQWREGVLIPKQDQSAFVEEFRPLVEGSARRIARQYGVSIVDSAGPTAAYEELVGGAYLGLVLAARAYTGGSPFLAVAQDYANTYAMRAARSELGAGIRVPERTLALLRGFNAARARARAKHGADEATPEQVAKEWRVSKKDVFAGRLGSYENSKGKIVNQDSQPLPMGDWHVRTPTGEKAGEKLPGKFRMVTALSEVVKGSKVRDSEWIQQHQGEVLPQQTGVGIPLGTAHHIRGEIDEVLSSMPAEQGRVLETWWGLNDPSGQGMDKLEDLAETLGLGADGDSHQTLQRKARAALKEASGRFQRIAEAREVEARKYAGRWSQVGQQTHAPSDTPTGKELLERFGGDEERLHVYSAALRAGKGEEVGAILDAEVKGEAKPRDSRRVRADYHDQRDMERLAAFRQHGATYSVDPSEVRDYPGETTDPHADYLYTDQILTNYMQAIAKRGMPAKTPSASGESRVWSEDRIARFMGRPTLEQLKQAKQTEEQRKQRQPGGDNG